MLLFRTLPSHQSSTVNEFLVPTSELREALRQVGRSRKRGRTAERMLSELGQMYRWAIKRQPWTALLGDGNPAELV